MVFDGVRLFSLQTGINGIHLRVKDANRSLYDGGCAFVSLQLVDGASSVGDKSNQLKADVLRLHVLGKGVRDSLLLARLHGQVVAHCREITDNCISGRSTGRQLFRLGQAAGQEGNMDRGLLVVRKLDNGLCRAAIDEFHAKDVRVGENRLDLDSQNRNVGGRGILLVGLCKQRARLVGVITLLH